MDRNYFYRPFILSRARKFTDQIDVFERCLAIEKSAQEMIDTLIEDNRINTSIGIQVQKVQLVSLAYQKQILEALNADKVQNTIGVESAIAAYEASEDYEGYENSSDGPITEEIEMINFFGRVMPIVDKAIVCYLFGTPLISMALFAFWVLL